MTSSHTYPTALKWARCVELANSGEGVWAADRPERDPRYWWRYGSALPRVRPFDRRVAYREYRERLDAKRQRHVQIHRAIPAAVRRDVLSGGSCAYCPGPAEVVDHVLPVSRGGTSARSNLAPACNHCNSGKLDMTAEEFIAFQWRCLDRLTREVSNVTKNG